MLWGLLVDRTVYIVDKQGLVRYAKHGKPSVAEILGVLRAIEEDTLSEAEIQRRISLLSNESAS
mgnify:CR=1 FL=1